MADNQNVETTKAAISEVIRASIEWPFPEKDTARLYSALAQDSSFFIFHPDSKSTIVGFEPFRKMTEDFFMQPEMQPLGTEIKDLRINLSASEDCAWWSCLLDARCTSRSLPTLRITPKIRLTRRKRPSHLEPVPGRA